MHDDTPSNPGNNPRPATVPADGDATPESGADAGVTKNPGNGNTADKKANELDVRLETLKQATIMIVDDEPIVIETLGNFLEDAGYKNFITTTDSTEALDLLRSKMPDIVLLDVMMPEVSGLDILDAMRNDDALKYIPSIIITAATDSKTKMKTLELGATEVLNKPVDASELALRLRNTLATKAHQDRLIKFDELTGLPNRRLFMIRFADAMKRAKTESTGFALLHIDLDHLKQVNDTLGISIGNSLLKAVARRLEKWIRDIDLTTISGVEEDEIALSRIGSDEFSLILNKIGRVDNATQLAGEILSALEKPFNVSGREVFITASIGIAMYPMAEEAKRGETGDSEIMNALLRHADIAMSEAKQRGRNAVQHYSKEINAESRERLSLETRVRKALESRELFLSFKPKANVWTNRVAGADALLCWKNAELGVVAPEKFLPIAEETGMIMPFCEWMLYAACVLNKQWQASGIEPVRVSVGVSSRQLDMARLMMATRTALERSGLEGKYLALELAESIFMEDRPENLKSLQDIKELGVGLSIGRFGTGYSSLGHLRRFPFDELKIDGSFVRGIPENADNAAIVSAFVSMTHSLDMTVVAEGVESAEQLAFLKDRGCDEFQGPLLSEPVAASEFLAMAARDESK